MNPRYNYTDIDSLALNVASLVDEIKLPHLQAQYSCISKCETKKIL